MSPAPALRGVGCKMPRAARPAFFGATASTTLCGAVDIYSSRYSFAILLCQLWTGRRPYEGLSTQAILSAVCLHNKRPSLEIRRDVDVDAGTNPYLALHDTMSALIQQMWNL